MTVGLIFLCAAVFTLLLTGLLRRYALARRLLDIPNERSSHTVPTPRGGGVAIVLTFLVALPLLGLVMAYAPLVWLAVRFKAGARELQEV